MLTPFAHTDLEFKQNFIKLARDYSTDKDMTIEKQLAASLLYMNVADYLAEYLVVGLTELAKQAISQYYLGVVTYSPKKREALNIGNSIHHLKEFDFPRKEEVLRELNHINNSRKSIAHEMLKVSNKNASKIDTAYESLVEHTELLIDIVDNISLGLPPQNIVDKHLSTSSKSDSDIPEATKN